MRTSEFSRADRPVKQEHYTEGHRCASTGKIRYPGSSSAQKAIRGLQAGRRTGGGRMHVYRCVDCGDHHIGHGHDY